jgi:hypothetical protein
LAWKNATKEKLILVFVEEEIFFGWVVWPNVFDALEHLFFVF